MTARHTISRADELYAGNVQKNGYAPDGRAGVKLDTLKFVDLGVPVTADVDGILDGEATFTNSTVTLTAGDLLLTSLDVPRNLQAVGGATTQTQIVTVSGTDVYGAAMTEAITMNGTTTVLGAKAFAAVSGVVIEPASAADTIDLGFGTALGLPFRIADAGTQIVGKPYVDGVVNTTAVVTTGLATTVVSTAGSGDVRGTLVSTGSLPNNARRYTLLVNLPNISDEDVVFGVTQA